MEDTKIVLQASTAEKLQLDNFVKVRQNFNGFAFDYYGDVNNPLFKRTRISPLYHNDSGMLGYLEISLVNICEKNWGEGVFSMGGGIDIPESILNALTKLNPKLRTDFTRDFKVDERSVENLAISPLLGVDLPESVYFNSYHPSYHTIPNRINAFYKKYDEDLRIMGGYLSKMHQWVEHAKKGLIGKERINYQGLARLVGFNRLELESQERKTLSEQK